MVVGEAAPTAALARAVREPEPSDEPADVSVVARTPHPVHRRVGHVGPELSLRTRTALAAAGRARGLSTRHDPAIERARTELAALDPDSVETAEQRRDAAASGGGVDRLRQRVAMLRGQVTVRREHGLETEGVEQRLRDAVRSLSEAETEATAAAETLERTRETTRAVRETLDEQLRLKDEVENARRSARSALVNRLRGAYAEAVAAVPNAASEPPDDPIDADAVTAGLAVARVARLNAPVVVACDRFEGATEASAWLGAPVIYRR